MSREKVFRERERKMLAFSQKQREKPFMCNQELAGGILQSTSWDDYFFSCTAVLDFHLRCVLRAIAVREFPDISNWSSDISMQTALEWEQEDWRM